MFVLQLFLSASICLLIVLHINFTNLGALIFFTVSKLVFSIALANIKDPLVNSYNLLAKSIFLDQDQFMLQFAADWNINDEKVVGGPTMHDYNPFTFRIYVPRGDGNFCAFPSEFLYPIWHLVSTQLFVMFCLLYNSENSEKGKKWFTIVVFCVAIVCFFTSLTFYEDSRGASDLLQFVPLLLMLLFVAKKRGELQLLFNGSSFWIDPDYSR